MARFTLNGLYNYMPDLFDDAQVPVGMNKQYLIDLIIERHGMLYMYHQVGDEVAKQNITSWFNRNLYGFSQMFRAVTSEYDPIENYDRKEDWTDTPDVSYTKSGGHSNTIESKNDITNENTVSAFNSSSYEPNSKNTTGDTGKSTESFNYSNETTKENGTRTHTGRIHGNIGVTTSQRMVREEISLRQYDIYINISDLFADRFLIQVY